MVSTCLGFVGDPYLARQREFTGTDCIRMDRHTQLVTFSLSKGYRAIQIIFSQNSLICKSMLGSGFNVIGLRGGVPELSLLSPGPNFWHQPGPMSMIKPGLGDWPLCVGLCGILTSLSRGGVEKVLARSFHDSVSPPVSRE